MICIIRWRSITVEPKNNKQKHSQHTKAIEIYFAFFFLINFTSSILHCTNTHIPWTNMIWKIADVQCSRHALRRIAKDYEYILNFDAFKIKCTQL